MIRKSKLVCLTAAAALTLSLFTGCSSQTTTAVNPTSSTDQTAENVETDTNSLVIAEQGIFSAG